MLTKKQKKAIEEVATTALEKPFTLEGHHPNLTVTTRNKEPSHVLVKIREGAPGIEVDRNIAEYVLRHPPLEEQIEALRSMTVHGWVRIPVVWLFMATLAKKTGTELRWTGPLQALATRSMKEILKPKEAFIPHV
jgi:hypothetical protein